MWTWSGTYLCYCSNCICICVLHVLCCVLVFVFFLLFSCICIFQRCVECWVVVYLCYRSVCQTNPQGTLASKYCDPQFGENHNKLEIFTFALIDKASLLTTVHVQQLQANDDNHNDDQWLLIIMMINDYQSWWWSVWWQNLKNLFLLAGDDWRHKDEMLLWMRSQHLEIIIIIKRPHIYIWPFFPIKRP